MGSRLADVLVEEFDRAWDRAEADRAEVERAVLEQLRQGHHLHEIEACAHDRAEKLENVEDRFIYWECQACGAVTQDGTDWREYL